MNIIKNYNNPQSINSYLKLLNTIKSLEKLNQLKEIIYNLYMLSQNKVLKQDSYGRVTTYMSGNGLITNKTYDKAGALNKITTGYDFDDKIRDLTFSYDKLANVTTRRRDSKLDVIQNYTYDRLNRVTHTYIVSPEKTTF